MKRLIASFIITVIEVLRAVPGAEVAIPILEMVAGFFGITGLGQAGVQKKLSKKKLASASAAISALIALSYFIPGIAEFRPYLERVAAILGSAAITANLVKSDPNVLTDYQLLEEYNKRKTNNNRSML